VINASACGVIQEAARHEGVFTGILGSHNGILGVLHEDLFDLTRESSRTIDDLRRTPASALGSCRYKLKDLDADRADYERILEVFRAHDIRFFFYIGGNDSMDTADKVSKLAADSGYAMAAVGVPKTIDNDLAETDHCPGYGSVAKYLGAAVMEAGRDTEAMYTTDSCAVLETMGRHAGWIAAATGVAQRTPEDAPHLVYVPEIAFSIEGFVADVKACLDRVGRCVVAASEGLVNDQGAYIATEAGSFSTDSFGHTQMGGVGELLKNVVEADVGVKCRYNKLGTCQRTAMHFASRTDVDEAYLAGQAAVRAAVDGVTDKMVTLLREGDGPANYACRTGLADLRAVANGEKLLPRSFMNEAGNHITDAMRDYVVPLMRGQADLRVGEDGLPVFARLARRAVKQKTGRSYSITQP
jgi:6-phosphofructokinase 1